MDVFQRFFGRALQQLRDLTISQRAAIFMGGALVVVALGWLLQWAAQPDMVAFMPQNLSTEELARVSSGLDMMNETHKIVGSQILVRADANKPALIAKLHESDHMPVDTSVSFESLVKEANPWISQEENDRRWTVALQREIELVMRQMNGVKAAHVFLNLHQRRGFSRETPPSTASVTLIMAGGESVPRQLARAAARMVSGAVRGLPIRNVQVVDGNGVSAIDWESEEPGGAGGLAQQRHDYERVYAEKIRSQLAFDPKVRVNVQVELDLTTRNSETVTPTDPVDVFEDRKSEVMTRSRPGGQPGVQPNVGLSAGGSGRDENSTTESTKTERIAGNRRTTETKPSGEVQSVFAAVNVSYSYLLSVFKRENENAAKVTTDQIQQVFEKEKARILGQITVLVKPQTEDQVRVDWYYDQAEEPPSPAAAIQTSFDATLDIAAKYAPHAGLGALALLSLALMFRMSKRTDRGEAFGLELGLPKDAIEAARKAAEDVEKVVVNTNTVARRAGGGSNVVSAVEEDLPQFESAQPIGRAAGTDGVLEAREVDEGTIQTAKMIAQIGEMVSADKDGVASVLEQWIRRKD